MTERSNAYCIWGMKIEGYPAYMIRVLKDLWGFSNYLAVIKECLRVAYRLNCFMRYIMNEVFEEASCLLSKILKKYKAKFGIPREMCKPITIRNLILEDFEYHIVKFLIKLNGFEENKEAVRSIIIRSIYLAFLSDALFFLLSDQYIKFVSTGRAYESLRMARLRLAEEFHIAVTQIDDYVVALHERCLRTCDHEEILNEVKASI